jgi:hypothetical protein
MIDSFMPLLVAAQGVDLADPEVARLTLQRRFDPQGPQASAFNRELAHLLDEGKIADRGELPVRWGRVAKASHETLQFSIDVVLMTGAGLRHRHPRGEVNYCVALEGSPTFESQPAGWVVLGPGTTHVPTVEGGKMLIVYLLPAGEIEFLA